MLPDEIHTMRRNLDPRMLTLKYNATCAETGRTMHKGETAVFYPTSPKGKNLFHPDSKTAEGYRTWKADQDLGHDY